MADSDSSDSFIASLGQPRSKESKGARSKASKPESSDKSPNGRKKQKRPSRPKRQPQILEPGPFHEFLGALALKGIEVLGNRNGVKLNLGETKTVEEYVTSDITGPEPIDIAARLFAHIGRRVPGADKLATKFEGQDKKSGFFTDLGVFAYSVLALNENLLYEAGEQAVTQMFAGGKIKPRDNDILDLGNVDPVVIHNNHMEE